MFRRKHSLFLLLLFTGILLFSAACGNSAKANNNPSSTSAPNQAGISSATGNGPGNSAPTSLATTTACPASVSGRAAVMPSLQLGKHHAIVFFKNIPLDTNKPSFTLQYYDVETGKTTTILSQDGVNIYNVQLSGDGQWILFIAQSSSASQMQLIRVDSKYLQTL